MNAEFMARNDGQGWKFYEGVGADAKQIRLDGNNIMGNTWEDIEKAVAARELNYALPIGSHSRVWLFRKTA